MPKGVIVHSDRGSQYCSGIYQKLFRKHQLICSMSKKGDCYDNAAMESWNHSFKVEATVRGPPVEPVGWVADLADLDESLKAVAAELDHGLLNERPGLERPTLENICIYFADRLLPQFPGLSRVVVSRPTIGESCALKV